MTGNQVDCTCTIKRWPLQKSMVVIAQGNLPLLGLIRSQRRGMLIAVKIAAATYLHCYWQLVSVHGVGIGGLFGSMALFCPFSGIDIDQLDDEVGVGAGGGGEQSGRDLSGHHDIVIERLR